MKYYAFISYNSADEKWAKWLQHNLEYYHVPSALCKEYPDLPKKIRPVFWYKQDLSGTKLKEALSKELESSKYLIVVCSPESAKSVWVNDEVLSFLEQGKGDRIIPFIVGGTPHAQNPNEECFPPALLTLKREEEIRGIDVRRKEGKQHALVDVIATMFGIRFDELWQRHKKSQRRKIIISLLFLLAIISICIAWRYSVKKELITQAKFIAAEAEKLAEEGDRYMCIKLLNYVANNNKESLNNEYFEHAVRSLDCNYKFPERFLVHEGGVNSAIFSNDGRYIVTASNDKTSKIWSVENGECVQTLYHNGSVFWAEFSANGEYVITEYTELVDIVKIWSFETGKCLYTLNSSEMMCVADDGSYIVRALNDSISEIWSVELGKCLHVLNHNGVVTSAEFSSDERYVVTTSDDGVSRIWSVATGECLHILYHSELVYWALFSPDSKLVCTIDEYHTVNVWSVDTGDFLYALYHNAIVNTVKFSTDSKYIVIKTDLANISIRSAETGMCLNTSDYSTLGIEFSSDVKYVATTDWLDRQSRIYLLETGECIQTLEHDAQINSSKFSLDDKYVITASDDNTSKIWRIESGECLYTMYHDGNVSLAELSADGRCVVTIEDYDNIVNLWSVELGLGKMGKSNCQHILNYNGCVRTVECSTNSKYIVAGLINDCPTKICSLETGECLYTLKDDGYIFLMSFSANDRYLLTISDFDDISKIWSVETRECLYVLNHNNGIKFAEFSPDSKYVVTASDDSTSKIWSVDTGECLYKLTHDGEVNCAKFSPDGKYVVTASNDKTAKLWSVKTGECLMTMENSFFVSFAEFSTDSEYIITLGDWNDIIKIWSVKTGECLHMLSHNNWVKSAEFSPNGKYVATASMDNTSSIWSVMTGENLHVLNHNNRVNSAVFSTDGKYVVTASEDKTSKIWSVETGVCLMTINHKDNVNYASFTPDGKYIITASGNVVRKHKLTPLPEILSRWSEILGPNAELTEEEKERYFLN